MQQLKTSILEKANKWQQPFTTAGEDETTRRDRVRQVVVSSLGVFQLMELHKAQVHATPEGVVMREEVDQGRTTPLRHHSRPLLC